MSDDTRIERDSLGEVAVPRDALWGAQTQRAVDNFPLGGRPMRRPFLRALGLVKEAAAQVNGASGLLDGPRAQAVATAAAAVAAGEHDEQFPVDVFQTGSGTSSNMNANEVIATLASRASGLAVHPNDHVNMCQSSNDVIPTCIHLSAALEVAGTLSPALDHLARTVTRRAREVGDVVKTGRTHLMDAMPVSVAQEMGAWASQVRDVAARLDGVAPRLNRLAIGGTAVGTGINAPQAFGPQVAAALAARTGLALEASDDHFRDLACQDTAVELSGQLRTGAVALMKIANDLRWMNSGPLAGLAEVRLPALQPGSSIMPGKVNPVIPEAVAMACARVMGNDVTVGVAGQSGSFQLNVMLPLVADTLLESIGLLANAARLLADRALAGMEVSRERVEQALALNPVLVTALNPVIGYEQGAAIAKAAYAEGRPVKEVAAERSGLDARTLDRLLDPARLTRGGLVDRD